MPHGLLFAQRLEPSEKHNAFAMFSRTQFAQAARFGDSLRAQLEAGLLFHGLSSGEAGRLHTTAMTRSSARSMIELGRAVRAASSVEGNGFDAKRAFFSVRSFDGCRLFPLEALNELQHNIDA